MKSPSFASIAMFAEDIRTEAQGINTVIGIMPDNINYKTEGDLEGSPQMPRLAIYVRSIISVDVDCTSDLVIKFHSPSGQLIAENPVTADFIKAQIGTAKEQNAPHATIISQFKMNPFPIFEHGQFVVTSKFCGDESIAGFLNIDRKEDIEGTE